MPEQAVDVACGCGGWLISPWRQRSGRDDEDERTERGVSRRARKHIVKFRVASPPLTTHVPFCDAAEVKDNCTDNAVKCDPQVCVSGENLGVTTIENQQQVESGSAELALEPRPGFHTLFSEDKIWERPSEGGWVRFLWPLGMNRKVVERHCAVPPEESCVICLEYFKGGQELEALPCRHLYHAACIDRWLENHTFCCVCKGDLEEMALAARMEQRGLLRRKSAAFTNPVIRRITEALIPEPRPPPGPPEISGVTSLAPLTTAVTTSHLAYSPGLPLSANNSRHIRGGSATDVLSPSRRPQSYNGGNVVGRHMEQAGLRSAGDQPTGLGFRRVTGGADFFDGPAVRSDGFFSPQSSRISCGSSASDGNNTIASYQSGAGYEELDLTGCSNDSVEGGLQEGSRNDRDICNLNLFDEVTPQRPYSLPRLPTNRVASAEPGTTAATIAKEAQGPWFSSPGFLFSPVRNQVPHPGMWQPTLGRTLSLDPSWAPHSHVLAAQVLPPRPGPQRARSLSPSLLTRSSSAESGGSPWRRDSPADFMANASKVAAEAVAAAGVAEAAAAVATQAVAISPLGAVHGGAGRGRSNGEITTDSAKGQLDGQQGPLPARDIRASSTPATSEKEFSEGQCTQNGSLSQTSSDNETDEEDEEGEQDEGQGQHRDVTAAWGSQLHSRAMLWAPETRRHSTALLLPPLAVAVTGRDEDSTSRTSRGLLHRSLSALEIW